MNTVAALVVLIPILLQIPGGIEQAVGMLQLLRKSNKLTEADEKQIRDESGLDDALYDAQAAAVEKRSGQ